MRTSRFKRALGASLAVVSAMAMMALVATAPTATASSPPGTYTDKIAAAGSDTTEHVMDDYFGTTDAQGVDSALFNIHTPPDFTGTFTVPGDANCGSQVYVPSNPTGIQAIPPNGSGAGRDAFRNSLAGTYPGNTTANGPTGNLHGCLDIRGRPGARVPSVRAATTDVPVLRVGARRGDLGSPSLQAPATMTLQNLRDIYNCVITNWNQLPGGGTGQIQRFMTQTGSGTRSFFVSNVLGFEPDNVTGPNCPANKDTIEENVGTDLYTPNILDPSGTNGRCTERDRALLGRQFVFQATNSTNPTLDVRGGDRPGGLTQSGIRCTASAGRVGVAAQQRHHRRRPDSQERGDQRWHRHPAPVADSDLATANFTAADIGLTVSGTNIPAGAVINAVNSATSITISIPTLASATGGSLTIGSAVVSEKNPNVNTATDSSVYPGVRLVFNVLDSTEPSYTAARDLVGFDDVPNGHASPMCGNNANVKAVIRSNGFLDLPALTSPGGNTNITCRLKTP